MEGLHYPYSENKGANQLRGYREADLRLCFRICKKPVFSRRGSNNVLFFHKNCKATNLYETMMYVKSSDYYDANMTANVLCQ